MKSIFNSKKGFTLVELLVSVTVTVVALTIIVGILTSTLRGSNKTDVIDKVRENGNYAISQISRAIKFAKSFDGASTSGSSPWTCQIMPPALTPTPTIEQYKSIRVTSFDGGVTTFSCNITGNTPPETIASNSDSLIDTTFVALPTPIPTLCFFTCRRERITDSPAIGINFTLVSKSTSGLFETRASIPFTTSIKVRN